MKKILITGSDGYIGENLYRKLKKGNFIYKIDKGDEDEIPFDCDGVVHLAALSGILACQKSPVEAMDDNIISATNYFYQARELGIPVVFTSSQSAKTPETSFYATLKRTIEMLAETMNAKGADIRVLRLANVYGGYKYLQKKSSVVKLYTKAVERKKPLVVHGDGSQARDFIHVYDVCEFITRALFYPERILEPLDVGTGKATTIKELAEMFGCPIVYKDGRQYGAESSIANVNKTEEILEYRARIKLEDIIGVEDG